MDGLRMSRIWMIAFTHYDADPRVRREAEALVAAGHRVRVLALRRPDQPPRAVFDGVEVIRLPVTRRRGREVKGYLKLYTLFFLHAFRHTSVGFLRREYDAVHVHTMPDFLVFAALLPRWFGLRVVLDVHDTMPELYAAKFDRPLSSLPIRLLALQERLATRFASRVIAVHEPHRELICSRGTPREKTIVIMNLPDERIFSRNGQPPRVPGDGIHTPFELVYHGTLAERHGVRTAILACDRLAREFPRLRLRVLGDGEERRALIDLVKERDLSDRVSFSDGTIPVDRLPAALSSSHLGIVPGRIDPSTDLMLPTKLLEYLRLSIPVVCSPLRAVRRYFRDDGLTYADAGDPDAWAAAIRQHIRDPQLGARQLERAGRVLGSHRWSLEKQKLLALYSDGSR
jgi:glycosyltransferase involved in cell wall biosynthesis